MVKNKIKEIKRKLLLLVITIFYNLEKNTKSILIFLLFFEILGASVLFGMWKVLGSFGHIIFLFAYLFSLIAFIIFLIKNLKYHNMKVVLFWLEKLNFKSINPLLALKDKPVNKFINKEIWILHKKNTTENLKNLKYFFPKLSFDKQDPLKLRFLSFFFLIISCYWAIQNNTIKENTLGLFDIHYKKENVENLIIKAWIDPPFYTNLPQKYLKIDSQIEEKTDEQLVPINSELNILIDTKNKNFTITDTKEIIPFIEKEKNSYEIKYKIKNKQNISIINNNEYLKKWTFKIINDKPPIISFLSEPITVNNSALSFVTKTEDDYGVKKMSVLIKKPDAYKHFEDSFIKYNLLGSEKNNKNNRVEENYFYKKLSSLVWAGSKTILIVKASDHSKQESKSIRKIIIPKRDFTNEIALEILKIREEVAKKNMTTLLAKEKIINLIKVNSLNQDKLIKEKFFSALKLISEDKVFLFNLSNKFFKELYEISEIIEDKKLYITKRNLEQIEQSLFDSVKQKETDKISNNIEKFKESIESLLNLDENENDNKNTTNQAEKDLFRQEINKLTQQIEDLLNTGSKKEANKKIQELKQLSENIKNHKKNKEGTQQTQKREEFINKLSELLNDQEIVMEETFNRAADRGKFEQSSEGSGGKSPKEKQEELRNTLGNVMREIGASESEIPQELGKADRAMRQASRDLENGRPDDASNAQGRAVEMIQRSINKIRSEIIRNQSQFAKKGEEQKGNSDFKDFLAESENIEYQGTAAGGYIDFPQERKIQEAKKIANTLYKRYNQETRNLEDKDYIKKLLDWY